MQKTTVSELKTLFPELSAVISKLESMSDGRHWIHNGIYVNIDRYETKRVDDKAFESHKRYIDVQIVLEGEEAIFVKPISDLKTCCSYDIHSDISFYYGEVDNSEKCTMTSGEALVLYPQDGHMTGIDMNSGQVQRVRKAVFKIPYRPQKSAKTLVMDVDGTLTDGKIHMSPSGEAMKAFNIKDGYGIHDILSKHRIIPIIITGRSSEIVSQRCRELGIEAIYQGVSDKTKLMMELCDDLSSVAYIGDDANDLTCMKAIKEAGGIVGCPSDAVQSVIEMADFVSCHHGGDGAVRDFIDWIVYGG